MAGFAGPLWFRFRRQKPGGCPDAVADRGFALSVIVFFRDRRFFPSQGSGNVDSVAGWTCHGRGEGRSLAPLSFDSADRSAGPRVVQAYAIPDRTRAASALRCDDKVQRLPGGKRYRPLYPDRGRPPGCKHGLSARSHGYGQAAFTAACQREFGLYPEHHPKPRGVAEKNGISVCSCGRDNRVSRHSRYGRAARAR